MRSTSARSSPRAFWRDDGLAGAIQKRKGVAGLTGDTFARMDKVTVRELRNNGGAVLDRVARGTRLIVTRDGAEVAELRPRSTRGLTAAQLIARRRTLPPVDPEALRRDVDALIDPTL